MSKSTRADQIKEALADLRVNSVIAVGVLKRATEVADYTVEIEEDEYWWSGVLQQLVDIRVASNRAIQNLERSIERMACVAD